MTKKAQIDSIFILFLLFLFSCSGGSADHQPFSNKSDQSDSIFRDQSTYAVVSNKSNRPKTFRVAGNVRLILDSLSSVKVMDSLRNGTQLLLVDGKGRLTVDHHETPIIIYTGMMKLHTRNADFYFNAYSNSPGQSLKVFKGQLIATKSYESDFPNTDTLQRGEMILINRDIDLMEKETFDTANARR